MDRTAKARLFDHVAARAARPAADVGERRDGVVPAMIRRADAVPACPI
jgi:hypothetical protein